MNKVIKYNLHTNEGTIETGVYDGTAIAFIQQDDAIIKIPFIEVFRLADNLLRMLYITETHKCGVCQVCHKTTSNLFYMGGTQGHESCLVGLLFNK